MRPWLAQHRKLWPFFVLDNLVYQAINLVLVIVISLASTLAQGSANHREDLATDVLVTDGCALFELQIFLDSQRIVRCGRLRHAPSIAHRPVGPAT
jgi:hypothetical protein